ncbi:type VI secretion system protein ImpF [Spirochaetia bacterium]|nr:type VI secretion system protein ImpF [Spirochaetia bacterium]
MADNLQYQGYVAKEEASYKPFVLRRLTDSDPYEKKETKKTLVTIKQIKEDIFENIDMLFNSRSHAGTKEIKGYKEVEESVYCYGISDFCGKIGTSNQRIDLCAHIVRQLQIFEPRLVPKTIHVELVENKNNSATMLELHIAGEVKTEKVNKEVLFISKMDLETGNVHLSTQ